MYNLDRLIELQNRMPTIHTYRDLCMWVADSIDNQTLHWPLYHGCNRRLGCDSTGGINPTPYAELCRLGLLTLSSQEGLLSSEETQLAYVKIIFPLNFPLDLNLLDANVYNETAWTLLKDHQWLLLSDDLHVPLTVTNGQVTYDFFRQDTLQILRKELPDWEGLTGERFGSDLPDYLRGLIVLYVVAKEPGPRNMAKMILESLLVHETLGRI